MSSPNPQPPRVVAQWTMAPWRWPVTYISWHCCNQLAYLFYWCWKNLRQIPYFRKEKGVYVLYSLLQAEIPAVCLFRCGLHPSGHYGPRYSVWFLSWTHKTKTKDRYRLRVRMFTGDSDEFQKPRARAFDLSMLKQYSLLNRQDSAQKHTL
jgi:hypothetical protein